jgi:hypothetical protein
MYETIDVTTALVVAVSTTFPLIVIFPMSAGAVVVVNLSVLPVYEFAPMN